MDKLQFAWQGEPIDVEFGFCSVTSCMTHPLTWYNFECAISEEGVAILPAIRITTKGNQKFVISNQFGIGVHKIINGGWPDHGHASLPDDGFTPDPEWGILQTDWEAFRTREIEFRLWASKEHPIEWARLAALEEVINKSKK